MLFRLVRAGFSARRKQLVNPLSAELGVSKAEIAGILEELGIKATARAEELSVKDYAAVAKRALQF